MSAYGTVITLKSKAVDIAVARLRKKMGWDAEIKAIRKFGYRFDPPSMG